MNIKFQNIDDKTIVYDEHDNFEKKRLSRQYSKHTSIRKYNKRN